MKKLKATLMLCALLIGFVPSPGLAQTAKKKAATTVAQTTSKPFKGKWKLAGRGLSGAMELNLYAKTIKGQDADCNDIMAYGMVNIVYGSGGNARPDDCTITSATIKGNVAQIKFISGRSGLEHKGTLTYNPQNKQIKVSNVEQIDPDAFGECYLTDGLVFRK